MLWQIALTGYTYVAAGHAAREGARELAVDPPSDDGKGTPYRKAGESRTCPSAWRNGAEIEVRGDVTVSVQPEGAGADPGFQLADDRSARRRTPSVEDERASPTARTRRRTRTSRREWELELMLRRLLTEERGQASTELDGHAVVAAPARARRVADAARRLDGRPGRQRRAHREPRQARDGDAEKAAHWALSSGLRDGMKVEIDGETATVSVRIPILVPGLGDDHLRVARRRHFPS